MLFCRNVDELEIEEEDGGDPAVNGVVQMKRRVVDHALDELGIHFYYETLDSDGEKLGLLQGAEETVEFELGLRVALLALVEGDGSEPTRVALLVVSDLEDDIANSVHTRVDG